MSNRKVSKNDSEIPTKELIKMCQDMSFNPFNEYTCKCIINVYLGRYINDPNVIKIICDYYFATRDIIKMLLNCGANVNTIHDQKWTPLMLTCMSGENKEHISLELLLSNQIKVNMKDKSKSTALHYASMYSTPKVIQNLINKGCNPNDFDEFRMNALFKAVGRNKILNVKEILKYKNININITNEFGGNCLHHCCYATDNVSLAKLLIDNGADMFLKDYKNKMPIDVAYNRQKKKLFEYLQNNMNYKYPKKFKIDNNTTSDDTSDNDTNNDINNKKRKNDINREGKDDVYIGETYHNPSNNNIINNNNNNNNYNNYSNNNNISRNSNKNINVNKLKQTILNQSRLIKELTDLVKIQRESHLKYRAQMMNELNHYKCEITSMDEQIKILHKKLMLFERRKKKKNDIK